MKCSEVENLLDDYLETLPGEGLDDAQAAAVALHIQSCPACASELEARQLLRQRLKAESLSSEGPSSGFLTQAVAQAAEAAAAESVTRPQRRWPRTLSALAATLMRILATGLALPEAYFDELFAGMPSMQDILGDHKDDGAAGEDSSNNKRKAPKDARRKKSCLMHSAKSTNKTSKCHIQI